ncbi:fatty acid oxidation complex subunit alpha FadB [Marinobacterium sp. D7]|uniref:fatty acid oxidation complex subunit alpha FadB n=1 Tax=Marinobacterium ramblicola TaxID=2849041 RepID=UPI001C2D1C54|nr:fatty acid oxidation complex subunit alpha FadB [Marinobacterium ramblicola]MBV1790566.1 fatty acid oxidation complex subunit alpha FadB [Marinobacterium ramblicola]
MYSGNTLSLSPVADAVGLVELVLDRQGSSVNSLNQATLEELEAVVELLESAGGVQGLLISSAKAAFVVGADVFEFPERFAGQPEGLMPWLERTHRLFCRIENLPFPSVAAVSGLALGGGLELALAADARVLGDSARVGFPEVNLGLCPGWGGTVRMSRLIGSVPALEMMLSGKPVNAKRAVELGIAASQVAESELHSAALAHLQRLVAGEIDWRTARTRKKTALSAQDPAIDEQSETFMARFSSYLNPHYPAPRRMIALLLEHAGLDFEQALERERHCFATLAGSPEAASLVGLFINEQQVRQRAKQPRGSVTPVAKAAVLGAGIMGGGIAYQSAMSGTSVVLKDIRQEALDLGLSTAAGLMAKQVEKGRLSVEQERVCLERITTTLDYAPLGEVGLVVEAVVENEAIKSAVLKESEAVLPESAILTSNTSTISISGLAKGLQRPERFCGMHFFNPVPLMPLVEVIRGEQSGDEAIASTLSYALSLGKIPILVNDCPGFLVNRVLFPYFNAFNRLLHDGVDFQRIDRVMEVFGWPMGPAYLADVIGLDTMVHADRVLQAGYPERMGHDDKPIIEWLLEQGALGQKNGRGFYDYSGGARSKRADQRALQLIDDKVSRVIEISDQEIVDRMMIPLCLESYLCLSEGVVDTAAEVDMGLILGLGFPKFRGGALRYIDQYGAAGFAERVDACRELGALYRVPDAFRDHVRAGRNFF